MKNNLLIFIVAASIVLSSCGDSGENEVKNVTKGDTTNTLDDKGTSQTESFKNLIKSDDGIVRGAKFNMSIDDIKKLEAGSQLEGETATQLDYMLDYASLEEAEINYLFDENKKLSAIEIHVYPKDEDSQDKVFAEFDKHFSEKMGSPISSDSTTKKWENKLEDLNVVLAKRGNKKIHDVNISISKIGAKPKA